MFGLSCSAWVSIARDTYIIGSFGVQFCGWPDGGGLAEQEHCVVEVLHIVRSELIKMASESNGQE